MTVFIANKTLKMLLKNKIEIIGSKCLILELHLKTAVTLEILKCLSYIES